MAGPDQDGVDASESLFVVLAIVAIVLLAAVFPAFSLFEVVDISMPESPGEVIGGSGGGGGNEMGGTGGAGGESPNGSNGSEIGSPGSGGSLSSPSEETQISGTLDTSGEPAPLFVAKETTGHYWRQTAYMTYTGTGWEQTTRTHALAAGVPNDDLTRDDARVQYKIELLDETTSVPTAWQPDQVQLHNVTDQVGLEASNVGGIHSLRTLEAGTTYTAVSLKPPDDPGTLRQTGRDYPRQITSTYTQVPEETPDRVTDFTAELTTDSKTPYDTAVTVRDWLRTNKEYDLNTSINTSRPIADQFIFEVERGYCQHFATTMTAMLRTQGIPARYVVGYAEGDRIGEDEYLVTSEHGHAWVEVYFEDVGWVTFEPTAASGNPDPSLPPQPPYNISLNRSAVAGAPVTIDVAKNNSPVVGSPVYVQGERISWTDRNGEVTTTLPYASNVTIVAKPPGSEMKTPDTPESSESLARSPGAGLPPPTPETDRQYAVRPRETHADGSVETVFQAEEVTINQTAENYSADTNVTIDLTETAMVGDTVDLTTTIREVPIRNGTVTLNGTIVGETDRSGQLTFALENVSAGEATVSVERGAVSGNTTLFVTQPPDPQAENESTDATNESQNGSDGDKTRSLDVSVSTPFDFPFPFGPGTVTVNDSAGPVSGALVTVDGVAINRTDANGTVSMRLPLTDSATVIATATDGTSDSHTVKELYRNGAILLASGVIIVLIVTLAIRRWGIPSRLRPRRLSGWIGQLLDEFLRLPLAIADAGRRLHQYLLAQWNDLRSRSFTAWLDDRSFDLAAIGSRFVAGLERFVLGIVTALRRLLTRSDAARDSQGLMGSGEEGGRGVVALWEEFLAIVQPPQVSTWTPGEIGRYAIDRGFPRKPVIRFVTWYRELRYRPDGPAGPVEQAQDTLEALQDGGDGE